jgi:hypothetical protein
MRPELLLNIENYDLRKLSKTCNYKDCQKLPSKEVIITETDGKSMKKKDLVSIYFCTEHYNRNIRAVIEKINNSSERGKLIEKKVFDIGYVTY